MPEDVRTFVETLRTISQNPVPEARALFDKKGEISIARAPGRLDVMGGIADYSGSLVLQLPTREAALTAVQRRPDRRLRVVSLGGDASRRTASVEMPLGDLEEEGKPKPYEEARAYFKQDLMKSWAAYVAGAFIVLMRERHHSFPEGADILIDSSVPEGKGVSSSAAVEVAAMLALCEAFDITLDPKETALLCQKVENLVVGAPCGVMDQMTAVFGEEGRLLSLLCQPAELKGTIAIPEEIGIWGIDSGIRHEVSGADYGSVRTGAFMGYRMILDMEGLEVEDSLYGGYLANVTPGIFEERYEESLPKRIKGKEFIEKYKGTADPVTRVDPAKTYALRTPTAHPIYEHHRVRTFEALLKESPSSDRIERMGHLMYPSHDSYSACGLGSKGTDLLVRLARDLGPRRGLYGAKITGGGCGGTVAVLGRRDARAAVEEVAEKYEEQTGHEPHLFYGSSPGAHDFGPLTLSV